MTAPDLPRTYSFSMVWRLIFTAVAGLMLLGALSCLSVMHDRDDLVAAILAFPICALMLWFAWRFRVTIKKDSIEFAGGVPRTEIRREQLVGYRPSQHGLRFVTQPTLPWWSSATVLWMIKTDDVFKEWLRTFPNLEEQDANAAEADALASARYGASERERGAALARARATTRILSGAAVVLFFWCVVAPAPYRLVILLAAALPLLCMFFLWRSRGLLHAWERPKDRSLLIALIAPAGLLAGRALLDFDIGATFPATSTIAGFALVAGLAFAGILAYRFPKARKPATLILPAIACGAYLFGLAVELNCAFDAAPPRPVLVQVLELGSCPTKGDGCRLKLSSWDVHHRSEEVTVARAFFRTLKQGETIEARVHPGLLGLQWVSFHAKS